MRGIVLIISIFQLQTVLVNNSNPPAGSLLNAREICTHKTSKKDTPKSCVIGYGGADCNDLNCANSYCSAGTCSIDGPFLKCECQDTHLGNMCELSFCDEKENCKYGFCKTNENGESVCNCFPGFSGEHCSRYNCNKTHPCLNGVCDGEGEDTVCKCEAGFIGPDCGTPTCEGYTCDEDKICKLISGIHNCVYPDNFLEKNDDSFDCRILEMACLNSGTCLFENGKTTCKCQSFYKGKRCQNFDCPVGTEGPCNRDNSRCIIDGEGYGTCGCKSGFEGEFCEKKKCDVSTYCSTGASKCHEYIDKKVCICKDGFIGAKCKLSSCPHNHCLSRSQCYIKDSQKLCKCLEGYQGAKCSTASCIEGKTCIFGNCRLNGQTKNCVCNPGWEGTTCETPKCEGYTKCKNGGSCYISDDSHKCNCTETGYHGNFCDHKFCENTENCINGRCLQNDNGKHCICFVGWSGQKCNESLQCRDKSFCKNGGTCVLVSNTYTCFCTQEFAGKNCEKKCTMNCHNGKCIYDSHVTETQSCVCDSGYDRPYCINKSKMVTSIIVPNVTNPSQDKIPAIIDEGCLNKNCENEGDCVATPTKYICACKIGFTGEYCEHKCGADCVSNQCYIQNGDVVCRIEESKDQPGPINPDPINPNPAITTELISSKVNESTESIGKNTNESQNPNPINIEKDTGTDTKKKDESANKNKNINKIIIGVSVGLGIVIIGVIIAIIIIKFK